MKRQQLAHILRAACAVAADEEVLVLGSQSILGSFDEDDLPAVTILSEEADIAFVEDADRGKADLVEGALGELSPFHQTNSYYAEGIHLDTVTLPVGWRERAISWGLLSSRPARPVFLEPHDLAVSKLVAHREKDVVFVTALIQAGLLDREVLAERSSMLSESVPKQVRERTVRWVEAASEVSVGSLEELEVEPRSDLIRAYRRHDGTAVRGYRRPSSRS